MFYFFAIFFNKFHPHITDSLLAIRIFLLNLVINNVVSKPSTPGIAEIVTSILFFKEKEFILLIIIIFLKIFFLSFEM